MWTPEHRRASEAHQSELSSDVAGECWIPVAFPQPTSSPNVLHGSWPPQKGQELLDFRGTPEDRHSGSRAIFVL